MALSPATTVTASLSQHLSASLELASRGGGEGFGGRAGHLELVGRALGRGQGRLSSSPDWLHTGHRAKCQDHVCATTARVNIL